MEKNGKMTQTQTPMLKYTLTLTALSIEVDNSKYARKKNKQTNKCLLSQF